MEQPWGLVLNTYSLVASFMYLEELFTESLTPFINQTKVSEVVVLVKSILVESGLQTIYLLELNCGFWISHISNCAFRGDKFIGNF